MLKKVVPLVPVKKVIPLVIAILLFFNIMVGVYFWSLPSIDPYNGVLIVETDSGQGSCFVVAEQDGWYYAITAAHVVDSFMMVDSELYDAEIVRVDPEEDVALIRFKSPEDYKIYSFARAEVGESCTTIGWNGESRLVYKGHIVSSNFQGHIVANGGILPGCSGGALFNEDNEIIGVTVALPVYGWMAFDSTALYVPARYAEAMVVTIGD